MLSQGIYSIVLLIFSNIFMTFAWYGHLKMREEFSWFASLPLIGVIAFSWAIAFFEYCLQVPAVYHFLHDCIQDGVEMEPPGCIFLPDIGCVFRIQEVR